MCDMSRQRLRDALFDEVGLDFLIDLTGHIVVVRRHLVCCVRRVRNVHRYRIIAAFRQPADRSACATVVCCCGRLLTALGRCPVVDGAADHLPPHICVDELALEDRGGSGQCEHDRRQRRQLIVQIPGLIHIAPLEGDLQAAAAHPEGHAIHEHLFALCVLILEERNSDVHLAPPALPDVGRERGKARVRVDARVGHRVG
mmetsp:Transcript_44761/g.113316  ORF Transcript_44761/g.113316 Transcript_44761/m.113316 type:complete len:200 (-) Transcript_44761:63-662(-)